LPGIFLAVEVIITGVLLAIGFYFYLTPGTASDAFTAGSSAQQ
jgi:hypothetical protein